jgi:hypothetical protein
MVLTLEAALLLACLGGTPGRSDEPIRVHPKNPRYFEWRGRPMALITSPDFDEEIALRITGKDR